MDKIQLTPVGPSVHLAFNPEWQDTIGEIVVYIPKVKINQIVTPGTILASMETSRCLSNIKSPIGGQVSYVNNDQYDLKGQVLFIFKNEMPRV